MKHSVYFYIESIEDEKNDDITKEWAFIGRFQLCKEEKLGFELLYEWDSNRHNVI